MSAWVDQFFDAQQARTGGVVRRSTYDVDAHRALPEILDRAHAKGWHVVELGDQILILCNTGHIQLL